MRSAHKGTLCCQLALPIVPWLCQETPQRGKHVVLAPSGQPLRAFIASLGKAKTLYMPSGAPLGHENQRGAKQGLPRRGPLGIYSEVLALPIIAPKGQQRRATSLSINAPLRTPKTAF